MSTGRIWEKAERADTSDEDLTKPGTDRRIERRRKQEEHARRDNKKRPGRRWN